VVLPGTSGRLKAKIRQIEPVSPTETNSAIPIDQRLLGIRVVLRLNSPEQTRANQLANPATTGTPVVVIFNRHRALFGWQRN
jgi:hypothetical protein